MDMKWTYLLSIIIYGVLVLLKVINKKIVTDFIKNAQGSVTKCIGFKKDFYVSIAMICIVVSVAINIAAVVTGHPINSSSIIITVLVIGMAILSGITTIYMEQDGSMCIGGHTLSKDEIKEFHVKKQLLNKFYEIIFVEPMGGYEGISIYVSAKNEELFEAQLDNLVKKS